MAMAAAWLTVGMDIAAEMLSAARRRGTYTQRAVADSRELAFGDDALDAVFSDSTPDHFPSVKHITRSSKQCYRI